MSRPKKDGSVHHVCGALLDVSSGASYLGFTEKQTRHMIDRGALPALRLRGRLFFRREALDRFLARKEQEFTKERAS